MHCWRAAKASLCMCPRITAPWELSGYAVSLKGYPLKFGRLAHSSNPLMNDLIMTMRERSGHELIQKWKVLWKLKKMLDRHEIVTMSVDQNGGVAGLFVPCFGVLASTMTSPAELHLATGTPIVISTLNRNPDGIHHTLHIWDVIEHKRTEDHAADVYAVIARVNAAVEKSVRAYPEQWLWIHQRWKTRPPGEVPGPDGLPPKVSRN